MVIRKNFLLCTCLAFLWFFPLPSEAEERLFSLNFWPLFHYISDPEKGVKEIEGLGPFFYWRKDPHQRQWGIRPLLCWTGDEKENLWRLEYLYPFGKVQLKEGDQKGYFAPLSLYRKEVLDGKKKWDFQFFPFFIGETEKGEEYGGVFPLYGTLLNRYGKDDIRFFCWPLYSRSTSEGVQTTHLFWPFFSWTEGERKKGYRFWPFYGRREEFGISRSEFLLWPIFLKQTKGMDTEHPVDEWMVFPFYLSKESKNFKSETFLWPFFTYARDRFTGFEQLDLPWPFIQSLKGEDLYGIKFFPFYGYKERVGEFKRVFFLYPLYQYEEDRLKEVEEKTHRLLLLVRIRGSEDRQGIYKESSWRIWPLFDYEKEESGQTAFSLFYLFPFKEEGLERNLFPLFRIFQWKKDPEGERKTNLLWGFYKRIEREEFDYWEVAHLIGVKKGKGWKTVSLLKGLFFYRKEGERIDLRILFLPFHIHGSNSQRSRFKSIEKGFANGWQEDRDIGDRFVSSGTNPYQF